MQTYQAQKNQKMAHKNSTSEASLLEIKREFKVPLQDLFKAFTNAEALKFWWWPEGLYADHIEYDFKKGGKYFINMKGYDKGGGGMCGEFIEIIPNERIVMTDNFADENGNAITAKEANIEGTWPELVYITFEFETINEDSSRFVLSQEGIPNEMQRECVQGWNQSFDKLQSYLDDETQ